MGEPVSGHEQELSALERIDTTVAHPARRYNYWLGGKDNFEADRRSAEQIEAATPTIRVATAENRRFLQRAVRYLTEQGIRQFLDIGTGIPTAHNTHEVAQAIAPDARIVYIDNDPIVLTHARALLTSTPEGRTAYIDADLREPGRILADPDLHSTLDLTEPVALMLVAILHFIRDDEDPKGIINTLANALPPGSYLVASHVTYEYMPPEQLAQMEAANRDGRFRARSAEQLAALLDGMELVAPGIVSVAHWRADGEPEPRPAVEDVFCNAAVARIG
ncbi:SAM-dependent methyltransferase [Dactylosporangium sp. NPDC049140]|uniref:SAM-dependent methyltransferase n=1 Tax=Dactylosporangium sp. NPDC049140 TaxID=3155647 RepID=UPI00340369FC